MQQPNNIIFNYFILKLKVDSSIYQSSGIYTKFPTYDFSANPIPTDAYDISQSQILACDNPSSSKQPASICTSTPLDDPKISNSDYQNYFIGKFLELDNYIPYLYQTQYLKSKVYRLIVQTYSQKSSEAKRNIFKVYPPNNIEQGLLQYTLSSRYYQDQIKQVISDPTKPHKIIVQGPYNITDSSNEIVTLLSLSLTFTEDVTVPTTPPTTETIYFHVRVELSMSIVDDFVKSHSFRSKNEIIVLNKRRQFVYITDYWKVRLSSPGQVIYDAGMQEYSGLDETTFESLITTQNQTLVTKLNSQGVKKEYLISPILLNDTFNANSALEYLQAGLKFIINAKKVYDAKTDNYFVILLYAEKDQMYEVSDQIQSLTSKQEFITTRLCLVTSFITIVVVYVATYLVTVKVDRPLRVLNNILKMLNNSVTIKLNSLVRIKDQLQYQEKVSQYQVKELVISFQSLIQTLIDRNQNNKNSLIKPKIDYPLNELELNFVKKTKGNQAEFDWEKLINDIQNKSNFPYKEKAPKK